MIGSKDNGNRIKKKSDGIKTLSFLSKFNLCTIINKRKNIKTSVIINGNLTPKHIGQLNAVAKIPHGYNAQSKTGA